MEQAAPLCHTTDHTPCTRPGACVIPRGSWTLCLIVLSAQLLMHVSGGILRGCLQVKNEEKADAQISSYLQKLPKSKDVPHHDIAIASPLPRAAGVNTGQRKGLLLSKAGLVLIALCWLKICSKLPERQRLGVKFLYFWASKKAPYC